MWKGGKLDKRSFSPPYTLISPPKTPRYQAQPARSYPELHCGKFWKSVTIFGDNHLGWLNVQIILAKDKNNPHSRGVKLR
jgi:hypothetical protein